MIAINEIFGRVVFGQIPGNLESQLENYSPDFKKVQNTLGTDYKLLNKQDPSLIVVNQGTGDIGFVVLSYSRDMNQQILDDFSGKTGFEYFKIPKGNPFYDSLEKAQENLMVDGYKNEFLKYLSE
jgi:hypothetical protein